MSGLRGNCTKEKDNCHDLYVERNKYNVQRPVFSMGAKEDILVQGWLTFVKEKITPAM
jgi:hypothetical protein